MDCICSEDFQCCYFIIKLDTNTPSITWENLVKGFMTSLKTICKFIYTLVLFPHSKL